MDKKKNERLTKREQQIMDIIYQQGEATAAELQTALPDPPTNSAVRSMIRGLLKKGVLKHRQEGFKYIYFPAVTRDKAKRSAMKDLLTTFFDGSAKLAFVELLDLSKGEMDKNDWKRLSSLIEKVNEENEEEEDDN